LYGASERSRRDMAAAKQQNFDYFLILDFEATCIRNGKPDPQEIIEFPILKVNAMTMNVEAKFHQYVQPDVHRELSTFCTELTGIIQEQVDGQPNLQTTLQSVHSWMEREGLLDPSTRSVFVTCGDWDLQTMLPTQCRYLQIEPAAYFSRWINIKKVYAGVVGTYAKGVLDMLSGLRLKHEGRLHSGIDDCVNIANILRGLAERGCLFRATGELRPLQH